MFRDPENIDRFCINFPCHCVLNQVDSDTNLLDIVLLTEDIIQATKIPIEMGENNKQKEIKPQK